MMKCTKCGAAPAKEPKLSKAGIERLPRAWKKIDQLLYCPSCWRSLFHLRAITFPIAGPSDPAEWPKLRECLAKAWAQSTQLANWIVIELAKLDVVRDPAMEKLPPFKIPYLYPHARKVCPELDPASVVSILNNIQANYGKRRLDTVWRGAASRQNFRYPFPYPIPGEAWTPRWLSDTERVPFVRVRIAREVFHLRLRGGKGFRRQLADFAQIVAAPHLRCEMALYRARAHESDHRIGIKHGMFNIMAKLVAWLPKKERTDKLAATLLVRTEKERFLVADPDGAHPWIINGDQVLRWQAEHKKRLQHLSEDRKYEKRWPERNGRNMQKRLEEWTLKHRKRMHSWCDQVSASVAKYAARQRVTHVEYEDHENKTPEFPWFDLRHLISQKLNVLQISFTHKEKSDEVISDENRSDE
jgi:hypothetical protein